MSEPTTDLHSVCLFVCLFVCLLYQLCGYIIEQFSIECRKTKTKAVTMAQHEPKDLEANTRSRRQARENACDQATFGFGFASDWLSRWREFYKRITKRSK